SNPKDRSQWYIPSIQDGRIWKLAAKEGSPGWKIDRPLREFSSDELIGLFAHPNDWYARDARRILAERKDASVVPRLKTIALTESDQRTALEGLWALYVTGRFDEEVATSLLDSKHEYIRAWTVRLLGDEKKVSPRMQERFVELAATDASVVVRSQLACTAKRLPGVDALPIIAQLLRNSEDVDDPHVPLLIWWAIENKAVSDRDGVLNLLADKSTWNLPLMRGTVLERIARRYTAEANNGGFAACARLLQEAPSSEAVQIVIAGMETQLAGRRLDATPAELKQPLENLLTQTEPSGTLVRLALRMGLDEAYPVAAARLEDTKIDQAERIALIATLGEIREPRAIEPLLGLLEHEQPEPVQAAALAALESYEDDAIGDAVVRLYPHLQPGVSSRAIDLLTRRKSWSRLLLAAVEKSQIDPKNVSTEHLRQMLLHGDADLQGKIESRWGSIRTATPREKAGRILAVSQILAKSKGDAISGKPLFTKHCATCHQLFGEGTKVGPDLMGAERKSLDTLLANVIDPSSVVRQEFRSYIAVTVDGRVFTGLLAESSPETVTILDAKNNRTVLRRDDLDELKASEVSLMPEQIVDTLSDQELRDLFVYVMSDTRPPEQAAAASATTTKSP
ncbi:MAG: c-type cytochrome, partial [Planctomycetaceae bacterium]